MTCSALWLFAISSSSSLPSLHRCLARSDKHGIFSVPVNPRGGDPPARKRRLRAAKDPADRGFVRIGRRA